MRGRKWEPVRVVAITSLCWVLFLATGCSLDYEEIPRGGGDLPDYLQPCGPRGPESCSGGLVCAGFGGSERCFEPCHPGCRDCFEVPPVCSPDCEVNSSNGCGVGDWCGIAHFEDAPIARGVLACYEAGGARPGERCFDPPSCEQGSVCIAPPLIGEPTCMEICQNDRDCSSGPCNREQFEVEGDGLLGFCEIGP